MSTSVARTSMRICATQKRREAIRTSSWSRHWLRCPDPGASCLRIWPARPARERLVEECLMRAWQFTGVGEPLRLADIPSPAPGAGQVVVDVKAAGLCHSDVGFVDGHI